VSCHSCFYPFAFEGSVFYLIFFWTRFSENEPEPHSFVSSEQLILHVLAYAEVLFRWKLLHKRIELLKAVDPFLRLLPDSHLNLDHSELGMHFVFVCVCVTRFLPCE
jgi:hypothetical protein